MRKLALPAKQAARGASRIGREPIFLTVRTRSFTAPRSLDVQLPEKQGKNGPAKPGAAASDTDPALARQAYSTAAGQSEALFDRILAAAARLAREADAQLLALTDRSESQLGQALARLEDDHAQRLLDAANERDATIERIANRTDILRAYVVEQANMAIGQMIALKDQVLATATTLEAPVIEAKGKLDGAIAAARTAKTAADTALDGLHDNPEAPFRASARLQNSAKPALVEAMVEAAVHFGPPRVTTDKTELADRLTAVLNFAEPTASCGPCEADGKLMGLRGHAENLGVAGPRAIRSSRDGALKSIDQTEEQLILSVMESHRQAENGLAERHDQTRAMLIAQSAQATAGVRRDLEHAGQQQVDALGGVAAAQPSALNMVHGEVEKAAQASPGRAAALAVQASARLRRNVASTAERHPGGMLAIAEKNRAGRFDKVVAGGREQLAMVSGFAEQQRKFIGETFDQVGHSVEETMADLAGVPGQVGHSCDSMLQAARQAIAQANATLPKQMAFIHDKLNDACDGLIPISPETPQANPQQSHDQPPESLVCTPADAPNMSIWNPDASSSSSSSSAASTMSSTAPVSQSQSTAGDGNAGGTPAPQPASCGTCDTARTAARDRARAASGGAASDADGGSGGGSGTATDGGSSTSSSSGAGDDVGVSSANTDRRSANALREHADGIKARPISAPNVDAFLSQVASRVPGKVGADVATVRGALPDFSQTNYPALMGVLRVLTPKQADALKEAYNAQYPDLYNTIDFNRRYGTWYGVTSTEDYNADAALAALRGNPGDAAIHEFRAAFNFSNERDRIFQIMTSMTEDQRAAFMGNAEYRSELEGLMTQLSDEDQARFRALMDGNTVRARSRDLKTRIDETNQRFAYGNQRDERGFALGDAIGAVETDRPWALEGDPHMADIYELEDPAVAQHRHEAHWADIQRDFGYLDGVADAIAQANPNAAVSRPDDPPGAALLAYATRPLEVYRLGAPMQMEGESREAALERQRQQYAQYGITLGEERTGEYGTYRSATTQLSEYQQLYLRMVVTRGSQTREARAARALAQFRRTDGQPPDYRDVEKSLHSGLADAREGGNFEHGSTEAAEADRLQTFVMMERLRRGIEGGATGEIHGEDARASFRSQMEAAYRNRPADLDVALGVIDSDAGNVQAVIDQAIAREDPALLTRYLQRMDSNQIEAMVTEWNRRHPEGPGLYERLGLFQHHWSIWHASTWTGPAFTGDEANALEIAMMGVPQTPKQRAEVALRVVNQQIEQAGWLGRLTCKQQYDDLTEQARHLREVMGVREGDIDEQGRIRLVDRDGNTVHMNFGADGQFHPAPGHDNADFEMLIASSRLVADNYANAVDRMAAMLTTIIAVIGAIVLTVVTFGAGASVLVAMAVAAGFGALTIGVNASMRGGRYSRDDLTRDVVAAAIQIATAGLNVGIARGLAAGGKLIQTGVAAERALTLSERLLVTAARNPMVTQMLTQGTIGGLSNLTSTALDPAMRRRDDYGDEVMHSFFRGFAGGAVTAGVAHGLNTGAAALARRFAVNQAIASAMARGASRAEAIEHAAEAAVRTSSGKFMEIGVRGLVGATSATAGRAAEMGFDNLTGMHQHGADEFYLELRNAFIQNAIQGMGEGAALRGSRAVFASHAEEHAATLESERHTAAEEAGKAFDREMARYGMGPEAPGRPAQARPGAPPSPTDEALAVRTADEEGGGRRLPAAANDNPGAPVRARIALAEGEMLRMGRVAEGSIFIHPESTNLHAANDNFGRLVNADPSREVAIYYNPGTGEYLVIQGGPRSVALVRPDGEIMGPGVTGLPASVLAQRGGHWELRTHFHPNRPGQAATNMARRLPSGQNGDFGVIEAEARFLAMRGDGSAERTSRIYFVDEGKLRFTDFSVRVEGEQVTYRVSFPDPVTGAHGEPRVFGDIAAYHAFFEERTGIRYPVAETGVRGRTADVEHSMLDPARRVGGETARLGDELSARNRIDAEFVAGRLGLAESFEAARIAGQPHETGLDPLLGRIATTNDAHDMVTRMGLVDRPDSMRRLASVLNDPHLSTPVKERLLAAVRDATREALVRRGALAPDEPLLLTLHGTSSQGGDDIRRQGFRLPAEGTGGSDDFGRGVYFSSGLHNALEYIQRRGGGVGEIFPAILRGRDIGMEVGPQGTRAGSTVDVTPQGVHREQWEAFVRANIGTAEGLEGRMTMDQLLRVGRQVFAENPANAGRAPTMAESLMLGSEHFFSRATFAELDRSGRRGAFFERFLEHLAVVTGDPRLASPHAVLGELGGAFTSGFGHGDQQALRNQRAIDIVNEQLGLPRAVPRAEDEGPSALRVRAVDEPDEGPTARVATLDPDVERQIERSFAGMESDADARGVSAERPGQAARILAEGLRMVNDAIQSFTRGGSSEAAQFAELLTAAPNTTGRILREIASESFAGRMRNFRDDDIFAIQAEIRANGRSQAEAQRIAEYLLHAAPGTRFHQILSEAPFVRRLTSSLAEPFAQARAERAGVRAARDFADRNSPNAERRELRRLLDVDTEGVVAMITGDGSWRSRAMRFAMRRLRAGATFREAVSDGFRAARILQSGDFATTAARWQQRANAISHQLLADMVRERPDALLHLARTSPQQLSEWFADYVLRQRRSAPPVIDADEFARYVENRQTSNILPIVSEASSVWSNFARMGLRLLKADSVMRGGANRPGLDLVGFSVPPGSNVRAGDQVRVVVMDDKAYRSTELENVSAMTGLRLPRNLRSSADEIDAGVRALVRLGEHIDNPQIAEYVTGARAAVRQMRNAARELDAIRPPASGNLRDRSYLSKVAEVLRRNNIIPVVSSEYGNVRVLAQWLRSQGFVLDQEYAETLARELDRSRRRASGG
uniref:MFS transporter n=1 Tax=Altererythrobacter segetis TaxID=1104773 RepID=UPI001A9CB294|nr:MFS transporter [Altererythrobacter segetis]